VVVVDLKRELWELTSGWRKEGAKNKVIRFEPAAASGSCGWNALDEIRIGTEHEIGDSQNLATLIVDPEGKGLRTHWEKTSQSMFVGCILYLCHRAQFGRGGEPATLPALDHLLADPARPVDKLWEAMKDHPHPVVAATGRDMLDRRGAEASDILSTAKSFLSSFRDPVIARNVSRSDFRIADLMNDDDPVSLYVVCEAKDQARLQVLVRILVNHVLRLLASGLEFEKGQPKPSYRHRLLLMLDEFPSLGKLDIMGKALATVATYGIKCYLIAQDLAQLRDQYGDNESITSNCHIQIAFPPNRLETAEHLSRLTGQATVIKEQVSRTGRGFSSSVSRTLQEVQRPLLTPDECLRMPGPVKDAQGLIREPGDMVVYAAGFPACYGRQPCTSRTRCSKLGRRFPRQRKATRCGPVLSPSLPPR
jgi:type IV secretion system protein VirD4